MVDASLFGDVGELAVAVVQEKTDAAVLGQHQVGQAVVVDVADRDAHAVAGHVEARAGADVGELAGRSLAKQLVFLAVGAAVVNEVDIEQPIAVEVEERHPRSHELRQEVAAHRPGIVDEIQAALVGNVHEPRSVRSRGRAGGPEPRTARAECSKGDGAAQAGDQKGSDNRQLAWLPVEKPARSHSASSVLRSRPGET